MLTWILVLVIVLWILGFVVLSTKLIHLLLIVAAIVLLLRIIRGKN